MKLNRMTRPWMPLTPACAPSAVLPVPAAAAVAVPAAERAQVSRVHQVWAQAELAQVLVLTNGINGTTGFMGSGVSIDGKRYTDGGSGVPPRGRPV